MPFGLNPKKIESLLKVGIRQSDSDWGSKRLVAKVPKVYFVTVPKKQNDNNVSNNNHNDLERQ